MFSVNEKYLMGGFRSSYFIIPYGFPFIRIAKYYFPLLSVNLLHVKLSVKLHTNITQNLLATALPCFFIITCKVSLSFFNWTINTWSLFFVNIFSCYLFVHIVFTVEKQVSLVYHPSECYLALSHFLWLFLQNNILYIHIFIYYIYIKINI